MEFAVDLAKNYGKSDRITRLLDKARVIVVPVVNVDGFELSRTDGEYVDLREANDYDPLEGSASILATPGQAYKRKNCRVVDGQDTPDGTCRATANSNGGFGIGVDLNRNYGGFWGGPGAAETEPDPAEVEAGVTDPTYRGASAFSEPETQNIQDLVSSRQVTMLISNHTFSNLVLRPNGVNPNTIGHDGKPVGNAPDEQALKKLGGKMSAQNGYANIHGWQLYDTTGTTEDWSYNATGGFGYTFEIGANEFHPPYPEVVDEYLGAGKYKGKGNREAYLIALEHAVDERYSGVLKGKAPKGATIRLSKTFQTPTWEDSFRDRIDTPIEVGADGTFEWIVNPSTRPVVRPRTYQATGRQALPAEGHRRHHAGAQRVRRPRVRAGGGRRHVAHRARLGHAGRHGPRGLPQGQRQAGRGRLLRWPAGREGAGRAARRPGRHLRPAGRQLRLGVADVHADGVVLRRGHEEDQGQAGELHAHLREGRQGPPDLEGLHRPRPGQAPRPRGVPPQGLTQRLTTDRPRLPSPQ